jgi:hypothetical protein
LDSDFKATRLPQRQINLKDRKGRRVGLSTASFTSFEKKIFDELNKAVKYGYKFTIKKGAYRGSLSKALKDTIGVLVKEGRLTRTGEGRSRRPFLYSLNSIPSGIDI